MDRTRPLASPLAAERLVIALQAALGAEPPEWVHLIPAGVFRGVDGRGPYRLADPTAVITASAALLPAPIDEAHVTDLGAATGAPAPARGWIVELQARENGIWGRVEWTDAGRALVADRAYRGISPVMDIAKADGEVRLLRRASLTNVPNLPQLTTLHAEGAAMDEELMKRLRAILGLDEAADAAAIITAMEAVMADRTMQAQRAGKALETATTLQSQMQQLREELTAARTERARERAAGVVDKAIHDGKPVKALRDHYISRHAQDPEAVERELAAMPSLHAGGIQDPLPAADADGLTAADRNVIALLGVDPKAFAAEKARFGVALAGFMGSN
jgi:phage I-like protein